MMNLTDDVDGTSFAGKGMIMIVEMNAEVAENLGMIEVERHGQEENVVEEIMGIADRIVIVHSVKMAAAHHILSE